MCMQVGSFSLWLPLPSFVQLPLAPFCTTFFPGYEESLVLNHPTLVIGILIPPFPKRLSPPLVQPMGVYFYPHPQNFPSHPSIHYYIWAKQPTMYSDSTNKIDCTIGFYFHFCIFLINTRRLSTIWRKKLYRQISDGWLDQWSSNIRRFTRSMIYVPTFVEVNIFIC